MTRTPTTDTTASDVVTAAMSVADDAAQGRVSPAALEQQAVTECRELFGTVAGADDPLWPLHVDIARQVLALDGMPADELAEWLAVARRRTGQPVSEPEPDETMAEPVPLASEADCECVRAPRLPRWATAEPTGWLASP